jgi:hypothetical protein
VRGLLTWVGDRDLPGSHLTYVSASDKDTQEDRHDRRCSVRRRARKTALKARPRLIVATTIGNVFEWFGCVVYGFFAATWLIARTGNPQSPSYQLMFTARLTLIAVVVIRRRRRTAARTIASPQAAD